MGSSCRGEISSPMFLFDLKSVYLISWMYDLIKLYDGNVCTFVYLDLGYLG